MSFHLFDAVIDWPLSDLDSELGIDIQGERINHLAFADDIVLFTHTAKLIGPVIWELVHPVVMPELERTIDQMKAGAPGPDGALLFKKLPRVVLKARYNLWLPAGYCPTMICRGEAVLIPKGGPGYEVKLEPTYRVDGTL